MERAEQLSKEIKIEAIVCKNLAALAEENGISPFLSTDIDDIVSGGFDSTPEDILKRLKSAHRSIHEVLYAPPRRG